MNEKKKAATEPVTTPSNTDAKIQDFAEKTKKSGLNNRQIVSALQLAGVEVVEANPITTARAQLDMLCNEAAQADPIPYLDVWSHDNCQVEFLLAHGDIGILARSNIHLIKGKRGSRKSYLAMDFILGAMGKSDIFSNNHKEPIKVLWADTEQDVTTIKERAQTAFSARRITPNNPIRVLHLRPYDNEQRRQYIFRAIDDFHPDLVIIDVVPDCMSFKPGEEGCISKAEVQQFIKKAEKENCAIVGIMHMNKNPDDTNASGHKGTAWEEKSAECYYVDKNKDYIYNDKRRWSREIEPIPFAIKNDWTMTSNVTNQEESKRQELTKMANIIMKPGIEYRTKELSSCIENYRKCKPRQASNIIHECCEMGIIRPKKISKNNVTYTLHTDNTTQRPCS